jgi:glutamine cyclotransferase
MKRGILSAGLAAIIFFSYGQYSGATDSGLKKAPSRSKSDKVDARKTENAPVYEAGIINTYSHDPGAFTQGLVYDEGFLYEGTGLRGVSAVRKIDLAKGTVVLSHRLPDRFFGEGVTVMGKRLIQLTWRSGTGFVYDKRDFKLLQTFHFTTEGWGITHDGRRLIMSDGTEYLYFLDPGTFKVTGWIEVKDRQGPLKNINELEYIHGDIYANVWHTDTIAIIHPETGRVKGWIDLKELSDMSGGDRAVKTLNGIAYDNKNNRLFVTGKLWPAIYEIKLVPPSNED